MAAGSTLVFETSPGRYVGSYSQCDSFGSVHDGVLTADLAFSTTSGEGRLDVSTPAFTLTAVDRTPVTVKGRIAGTAQTNGSSATTRYAPQAGLITEAGTLTLSYASGQIVDVQPAAGQTTTKAEALSFTAGGHNYLAQGSLSTTTSASGLGFAGSVDVSTAAGTRVGSIQRESLTNWVLTPASEN